MRSMQHLNFRSASSPTATPRRALRGFTLAEAGAVAAVVAIATAVTIPVFRRVGCSAGRAQSAAQLATLAAAHTAYAADFNDRQYTACPDNLGVFGGSFSTYQAQLGCIPNMTIGTTSGGETLTLGHGSGDCPGVPGGGLFQIPLDMASTSMVGSYRWTNVREFNGYVNGRFYDQTFYAPDDPAMTRKVQKWIDEGRDVERDAQNDILNTTYDYSPAAMYHPRVFGDGTLASAPSYQSPNAVANGEGYRSPSNSQCQYPSLKTRMLERHCMEPYLGPNPAYAGGRTPYLWTQSFRARAQALFFDGSVRLFTTAEAMDAEGRARVPGSTTIRARLWVRNSIYGDGFGAEQADDFVVDTGAHYLTAGGIRGRDTLSPP